MIVLTDFFDKDKLIEINDYCHKNNKGFITSSMLGLYGFAFVDYGEAHKVHDKTGEECKSAIVASITNEEQGLVTTHDEKRHGFEDDDFVSFSEVEGMPEVNGQVYQIQVKSPFSFAIKADTTKFGAYTREGIANQVKVPVEMKFKSFANSLKTPWAPDREELDLTDWAKFGRPELMHVILNGVYNFHKANGRLPELLNEKDADELLKVTTEFNEAQKAQKDQKGVVFVEELDKDMVRNTALYAGAQISPLASFWGGVVAQEIVKYTGKFTPIRQWLHHEVFEALPEEKVTRSLEDCRYHDVIAIFGKETMEKLSKLNLFMIGAGALGCEFMKLFALTGFSTAKGSKVTVTDDDNIEVSNLNRQFLFRKENVGKSKAECAANAVKNMNPHYNVEAFKERVAPETENLFNDDFWNA